MRAEMNVVLAALVVASLVSSSALSFSRAEYANALDKSILFFDLQRSGKLPGWQRLKWRGNSGLSDGRSSRVDLSGGYYDAGDNVKFGLPMAFSVAMLAWDVVEFGDALRGTRQLGNTLNAVRWGTDYLLKASTGSNELWVQVGNPNSDHKCWQRPEEMDTPRTAFKVDAKHPGSDVAGETAAALAAASVAFRNIDKAYSSRLLAASRRVFAFADRYRGKYSDVLGGAVCPYYCSYSGYQDELMWGAAWLYKATGENGYLQYLIRNGNALGGTRVTVSTFSWDNKYAGAQVLLAQTGPRFITPESAKNIGQKKVPFDPPSVLRGAKGLQGYKDRADGYICAVLPRSISPISRLHYSPGGMLFYMRNSNMQYVTSASFLLTTYARHLSAAGRKTMNCGGRTVTPSQLFAVAQRQVDYILGRNPSGVSYMIGFGRKNPTQVHHRAASMPSMRARPQKIQCLLGFRYFNSYSPNANVAMGAVLGGPDQNDNFKDARFNFAQTESTTYINAPIVGVLSGLAVGRQYF